MRLPRLTALVGLIGLLFTSLVLLSTEAYLYSRNTLVENGRWENTKLFLELTPMGSHHFLMTRNALQGNKLRLGAWHGNTEVLYGTEVDPGEISFSFQLDEGGYLCALFNRTANAYDGIRVSRSADFPNQVFHSDGTGRFLTRERIQLPILGDTAHRLTLRFLDEGVSATLDGEPITLPLIEAVRPQWFGFRIGQEPVAVDDVRVVDRDGADLLVESFRNTHGYGRVAALAAGFWGVVLGSMFFFSRGRGKFAAFRLIGVLLMLVIFGAAFFCFDFLVWSGTYPYAQFAPGQQQGSTVAKAMEDLRHRAFGNPPKNWYERYELREHEIVELFTARNWYSEQNPYNIYAHYFGPENDGPRIFIREELAEFEDKAESAFRMFFMGGSQTYGEGADAIENTFVALIHKRVAALGLDASFETFNFAFPGAQTGELYEFYEQSTIALGPDLIVLNVSYNDPDPDVLCENIRRFVKLSRERGVEVVLVIEPAQIPDNEKHQRMRALGVELGVDVHDLRAHMNTLEVYDIGLLWWDFAHASTLGQVEFADWLTPRLTPVIERIVGQ